MEPIQNEGQQNVDNVKLIVASQLHIEGDEYFYKLLLKDAVDAKREDGRKLNLSLGRKEDKFEDFFYEDERVNEYYLLPVEVIILAPGIEVILEIKTLAPKYKSILSKNKYISYDENLFSDIYKIIDADYEIIFPIDVTTLNKPLYGKIVDVESSIPLSSSYVKYISRTEYYEVKLIQPLFIGGKNYRNIYLPSKGLLKGFSVKKFTLNPASLFQKYFSKKDEKLILIANFAEKEDVLDAEDLKLFRWADFYKSLVNIHGWFIFTLTAMIIWINSMTSIDYGKNWPLLFITFGTIWLIWIFHSSKNEKIQKLKPERKDDLLEYKKVANIKGMVFWTIVLAMVIFSFSKTYTYNSPYVYDTKTKTLIRKSTFSVDMNEIFSTKKVQERYTHVYDSFTAKLYYKNKNETVTAQSDFLALDIKVKCNYGIHLVDIEESIASAEARLQKDISNHKFGNWDKKDLIKDSDFQKSLVDVRKTLWEYIVDDYTKNHDIPLDFISDIIITPRYTRLQ